jgi:hypothetical protein
MKDHDGKVCCCIIRLLFRDASFLESNQFTSHISNFSNLKIYSTPVLAIAYKIADNTAILFRRGASKPCWNISLSYMKEMILLLLIPRLQQIFIPL